MDRNERQKIHIQTTKGHNTTVECTCTLIGCRYPHGKLIKMGDELLHHFLSMNEKYSIL